jgi:Skp family chaperone for outer membrane proteins
MKQIGILAACVCLCAVVAARAQNETVAVVDMEQLVRLHPNTASDDKLRDQTIQDLRDESQELQQKLEAMKLDYEKLRKDAQDPALSDKARKEAEGRADSARDALIAADRTASDKIQAQRDHYSEMNTRMLKKIIADLREVVGKYAAEKKIKLVLPAAQVVYNEPTLDITDAILKRMNIERPAKATTTDSDVRVRHADAGRQAGSAPVASTNDVPAKAK